MTAASSPLAAQAPDPAWSEAGHGAPAASLQPLRQDGGGGAGFRESPHRQAAHHSPASPLPHELIVGGQRSGKSRRAERLAAAWLNQPLAAGAPPFGATFIATAQAHDADMQARIERHRADRARSLPRMACVEAPLALARAVRESPALADARHLLVVDCLTLWLSNLMHAHGAFEGDAANAPPGQASWELALAQETDALLTALRECAGPVVLVSNEVGLGVIPMGRDVRAYVDALGRLNQAVAGACARVCLMVAGQALMVKQLAPGFAVDVF